MNILNERKPNILLIGDIMLDVQVHGTIEKLANEAPIPVLLQKCEKKSLGGCGNVLMNLVALECNNIFLVSMIGNDTHGDTIEEILKENDIQYKLCRRSSYCTTVKNRGFADKKIIFRYDIEQKNSLSVDDINAVKTYIDQLIMNESIDKIILSDYNKGFMVKEITQYIIQEANKKEIPTFVDPKNDYTKYIGCTIFKPNIKEIYDIFGLKYVHNEIENIHKEIKSRIGCKYTVITLSEKGISCLTDNEIIYERAHATEVCDVTGAGDVVLSLITYFFNILDIQQLMKLATWIATKSVTYIGTYIIKRSDILEAYKSINDNKLISKEALSRINCPIVVTNGCFDIVHEGHISLFKFCKSIRPEGGHVVLALNGDESIKRLKGNTRPINNLESRISLLNEIESIDYIVVFNEDTPYSLYKDIYPTILVKGGDYKADEVIGREFCKEVRIFDLVEGKSTTNIIKKIMQ